jgi:hypothetical protein
MGASFDGFKNSLELAKSLRKIERDKFQNVRLVNQPFIMGLRGGAAVLMVAAFEDFLKSLFETNISTLNTIPSTISIDKLPDKMKVKIVFGGIKKSMDGPMYMEKLPKHERIPDILIASKLLHSDHIDPKIFADTGSNPNSQTVKNKFKEIGIPDIFLLIKASFERKWGVLVADRFIMDKLDEIVRTRHKVAHTADTLNITKSSQNEALKFLKVLAELLENEMSKQIKNLYRIAKS